MLPLVSAVIKKVDASRGKALAKASSKVETVLARRSRLRLVATGMRNGRSGKRLVEYNWQAVQQQQQQQQKLIAVHPMAQVVSGLLATITSLRAVFLGRESPWKPGTGVVVGQVMATTGEVMRQRLCLQLLSARSKLWVKAPASTAREAAALGLCGLLPRVGGPKETWGAAVHEHAHNKDVRCQRSGSSPGNKLSDARMWRCCRRRPCCSCCSNINLEMGVAKKKRRIK